MNSKEEYTYRGIKIIFTIISVMLMFPLLVNGEQTYYRTLFIFLIGKVIDLFFKDENKDALWLKIWDIVNQYVGSVACAFAFCAMIPDFSKLYSVYVDEVNTALMLCVISCLLKDIAVQLYLTIKIKLIKKDILDNINQLKIRR